MKKLFVILALKGILMSATVKNIEFNNTTIPVIFEKNDKLPIFDMQLIFKNSGYINDIEKPGITNIVAKLLDEGTKKDGSVSFARKLESKAINLSVNTGFETFVIEISCLKEQKDEALKLLKELLEDPNFSKDTLTKIKTLQISKLKQKENDFDFIASTNLNNLLFPNSALAYPSIGTIKSIENIKLKNIKDRFKSILNINNLIIAVGGDIKYKKFKSDIKVLLNSLYNTNDTKTIEKLTISKKQKKDIIYKDTQQAYIYFGSPFYIESDSKDNYKAKVASFILGASGFGSRLMEEIRVKHGLAYSAYGYILNKKSYSKFTGYLQTKLENQQKAQDMVQDIIDKFIEEGATQKELDAAKQFLSGSEPLRTETFSQRLNRAFHLYYKNLPLDYPKKELEKIDKLTLDELNSFIKEHKEMKKLSFSIVTKKQ